MPTFTLIQKDPAPPGTIFETAPISAPSAGTQLVSTKQWNNLIDILEGTVSEKVDRDALELGAADQLTIMNAGGTAWTFGKIADANVATHTSTKITITAKGQLNSALVYNDQTNAFGDFEQSFKDNQLKIFNPADTFKYIITAAAIGADRILNLPLLTGTDTIVAEAFAATLTNKTLGTGTVFSVIPTINDGITFTFNPSATVSGINTGAHTANPSAPVDGDIIYNSTSALFQFREAGTWKSLAGGAGDNLGNHTATQDLLMAGFDIQNVLSIQDSSANEQIIFASVASAVNEITISNAATTVRPSISASGETNIGLRISPKGIGFVVISDGTDTTKLISVDLAGATTAKVTTLDFNQTLDRTITFPDATDTLMGKATIDIMTNKTFDADGTGNSITNIENADIKAAAGIVYSKLNLATSIVDGDIAASGITTRSKLPTALAYEDEANVFTLNQQIERTGAIPTYELDRPEVLADTTALGALTFNGFSSTSVARKYAEIRSLMADDTNTTEDGGLVLSVLQAGALTDYIKINDAIGLDIDLMKPVNFNSQNATNLGTLNTHTIPSGTDTFAMLAASQTLTTKTIALGSNTVSGTKAQFDTAVTDDNFAYIGQANIFTANQSVSKTGAIPTFNLDRPEVLADGVTLDEITITGFSSTSVARTYGKIYTIMEDDTNTTEDSSMRLAVMQAGTLTDYIKINDVIGLDIDMMKPVNFNAQALSGVLSITMSTDTSHIIDDTASILRFKVPTGDTFAWQINAADVMTLSATALNVASGLKVQENGVNISPIGLHDVFVRADGMYPRTTGGCAAIAKLEFATSLANVQVLDFDTTTQEFAQFTTSLPRNWNNGTIKVKVYWTATVAGSGGVVWGISCGAYSDGDLLTTALGTEQTTTDTLIAVNDVHISPQTAAITIAGTPADADYLVIQISRNPADASDTYGSDARLFGVSIEFTTDAAVAA